MSTTFTCNTCGLAFGEADFQRQHMKTDWHRYNLKRRVASLPPVPSDVFAEKMIEQRTAALKPNAAHTNRQVTKKDLRRQAKAAAREKAAPHTRTSSVASALSSLSLGEPVNEYVSAGGSDSEDSAFDEQEEDQAQHSQQQHPQVQQQPKDEVDELLKEKLANQVEIPPNVCFMDNECFETVEENADYLERKYGLVIPDRKNVCDLKGLFTYINEKIGLGNCCLACSYMGRTLEAVRAHMLGKQHVRLPYDSEPEIDELAEYYDYGDDQQGEWEDVSDAEGGEEDGEEDGEAPEFNGYELAVAPGIKATHRSLQRYYKQRFVPQSEKPGPAAVRMIDVRSQGVTEKQALKHIKDTWRSQQHTSHTQQRKSKYVNHQKHYRDQLLQ